MLNKQTNLKFIVLIICLVLSVFAQKSPFGVSGRLYNVVASIDVRNGDHVEASYDVEVFDDAKC